MCYLSLQRWEPFTRLIFELKSAETVFRLTLDFNPVPVWDPDYRKMRQKHFASSLLALCFLVCSGLGLNCDWEHSPGTDQSLHTASVNAGDFHMDDIPGVSDPESCRAACCDKPDCDMVLVGHPADGPPQCQLVKCLTQSRDACVFQPSTQLEVYRKKVKTETRGEAKEGGEKHIVPLLGSVEPKTNETNNSKTRKLLHFLFMNQPECAPPQLLLLVLYWQKLTQIKNIKFNTRKSLFKRLQGGSDHKWSGVNLIYVDKHLWWS